MNEPKKPICHRDGTVSFWSVYSQVWIQRATRISLRDEELAAMPAAERDRISRHLAKAGSR
jgi:hypothetical protein